MRQLEETNWEEVDECIFAAAWETEVAGVPEFSTSTFHVVNGLLLPQDYCRVYRLQTDEGERIVGRLIVLRPDPALQQLRYRPVAGA